MKLEGPYQKYVMGKSPSHSSTSLLSSNFSGIDQKTLLSILEAYGAVKDGKIASKAISEGLVDTCGKKGLWNLDKVHNLLKKNGMSGLKRVYANQTLTIPPSRDFSTLSVIASHFDTSATTVGKWMDELGMRDKEGLPLEKYIKSGMATVVEMQKPGKKKQYTKFGKWNLHATVEKLRDEGGHPLDFDYEKSLKGKGRNSDVKIDTVDSRVSDFCKEFTRLYNSKDRQCLNLVAKTPRGILERAEIKLQRPGFFLMNKYKRKFS